MTYSEKVFTKILEIAEANKTDIVEAASIFCEEYDIDMGSFIKTIDSGLVEQLKYTAIQAGKVRRCAAKPIRQLPF